MNIPSVGITELLVIAGVCGGCILAIVIGIAVVVAIVVATRDKSNS